MSITVPRQQTSQDASGLAFANAVVLGDVGGSFLHSAELDDFERLTGLFGFGFHARSAQDQDGAVNGQGRPRRWNPMLGQPNMLTAQQRLKAARELVVVHLPGLILLKLVI